jgi:hypothetical protein
MLEFEVEYYERNPLTVQKCCRVKRVPKEVKEEMDKKANGDENKKTAKDEKAETEGEEGKKGKEGKAEGNTGKAESVKTEKGAGGGNWWNSLMSKGSEQKSKLGDIAGKLKGLPKVGKLAGVVSAVF